MRIKFFIYLIIPLVFIIGLFFLFNYLIIYPSVKENIINEKKIMLRELTMLAVNMIENIEAANKDKLDQTEIKNLALEQIRKLNYGVDQKSYFWITDLSPKMLMHPYRKDLEGTSLAEYRDVNGTELFNDAVKIVTKNGEGYLEYYWQWQNDSTETIAKISYVKLYKNWSWIIGTGVYTNDIETELSKIRKKDLKYSLLFSILIFILIITIAQYGIKSEKQRLLDQVELTLSEEKFRNIFHESNDIILISDLNGEILDINNKALLMYGLKYDEIIGKKTFELIHEKYHPFIYERLKNIETRELEPIEIEIIPNKGQLIPVEIKSSLINYKDKIVLLSILRDITIRKAAEQKLINAHKELEISETKFKNLSNLTFEGIAIHENGLVIDVNLSFLKMFGYSRNELLNHYVIDWLFDEESTHKIIENIKNNYDQPYEVVGIKKDGSKFPVEIEGKNYFTKTIAKSLRVTAFRDITLRKKTENEVRKLSKAVEQSANLVIITDIKGTIEYANERFYKTTGFSKQEVIGNSPRILKSGKQDKQFYTQLWKTILAGQVWRGEICNKKKNGDLYWESTLITPVFDEKNEITNFMSVKEDITDKKLADIKLFNAIIETEEKERKKFAEDLHDELGPYLSGIRLYINELEDEKIKPERRTDIVRTLDLLVKEAIDKTRSISNQLMPSILIDYGLIKALNSFCSKINNTNAININFNHPNKQLNFDSTTEIVIYRVIIELINNTIKHAKAKNISIHFIETDDTIEVIYKDDGLGFNLKEAIRDKKGLGLNNIMNRIKTLEATMNFESYPNKGVTFSFTFIPKSKSINENEL